LIEHPKFDRFLTKIMLFLKVKILTDGAAHRPYPKSIPHFKISKNTLILAEPPNRSATFIGFYRFLPVRAFSSEVRPAEMTKPDQTGPEF
jgi:hypothetical protein